MSDRVTVVKPTEQLGRLRMWTDDAAAELTRLRAELAEMTTERDAALEWAEKAERLERELAEAQRERDAARSDAERYLRHLTAGAQSINAAKAEAERLREFVKIADALNEQASHVRQGYSVSGVCIKDAMMELGNCVLAYDAARAALGEPQ